MFYTISKLAFSRNPRFDPQKIQKKKQAKQLKSKLQFDNIILKIEDGINYNYVNEDIIFIANLVIPKTKVLKRIAMTCKPGAKILIRVPIVYGSLLSEDVNYTSINSFKVVNNIEPSKNTDDILYKVLVLEKN